MANTIDKPTPLTIITSVPNTGADVNFTLNPNTYKVSFACSVATNMAFAAATSGHALIALPVFGTVCVPWMMQNENLGGVQVTFNGASGFVIVIEELSHQ